jgi:tetratricopeptide (TPR) repeat protein
VLVAALVLPQEARRARERLKACVGEEGAAGVLPCREALAEALTPAHRVMVLDLLAKRFAGLERWEEALDAAREAVKLQPEDAAAQIRLGETLLYALGRPEEAIQAFREAAAANPEDPRGPASLGAALNVLGRFPEAAAALEESSRRDPSFFDTHPAARVLLEASQRGEKWPPQGISPPDSAR